MSPRTEAGRALTRYYPDDPGAPDPLTVRKVEDEAAALAVAERLAELRAAVEKQYPEPSGRVPIVSNQSLIHRRFFLALLGSPQPPEAGL